MAVKIALDDEEAKKRLQMLAPLQQMQAPAVQPREKSATEQATGMVTDRALTKGVDYGFEKAGGMFKGGLDKAAGTLGMTPTVAPSQAAGMAELAATSGPLNPISAQAVLGSGSATAPLVADAAGTMGLASGAAGAGTGMAALGTAMPYIGAALMAGKAFGLFSGGGKVGPLSMDNAKSAEYRSAGGEVYKVNYNGPLQKGE